MRAAVLAAALTVLFVPATASAQSVQLDGSPLDVFVDGVGGLQVRYDGQSPEEPGEFCCSTHFPGDNGFALRSATETAMPGEGRTLVEPPKVTGSGDGTRTVTSTYDVTTYNSDHNPDVTVRVVEAIAYTDGSSDVRMHLAITNSGKDPASFTAGELADLYAGGSDFGKGVLTGDKLRFVGGTSQLGGPAGLAEVEGSEWTHYEEAFYDDVFAHFASGGLKDSIQGDELDNGVGAEWAVDRLAPGDTKDIDVIWRFDTRPIVTVNSIADHDDTSCDDKDCTLREALNHAPTGSTVVVPAGKYVLDPVKNGELTVADKTLGIGGAGAQAEGGTTIDAGGGSRVLHVLGGTVHLTDVRLTGGNGAPGGDRRALALPDGGGGALGIEPGAEVTVADSEIVGNTARQLGGGIANYGTLTVVRSTIARNVVTAGEGAPTGGGVFTGDSGSTTLANSTVGDNEAVDGSGGGIAADGPLTLLNTTIAGNQAASGGGIYRIRPLDLDAINTIVAGNKPDACAGEPGGEISTSHNLADDLSCPLSADQGDLPGKDPQLGELGDHGGRTETYLPAEGSPALDAGDQEACFGTLIDFVDQRGGTRFQGSRCDIGSVEQAGTQPIQPPIIYFPFDGEAVNTAAITFSGTSAPLARIVLAFPGGDQASTVADGNGSWSIPYPALADGDYKFTAEAFNPENGQSYGTTTVSVTIDTKAPDAPQIDDPGPVYGTEFTLTGKAEPGTFIEIYDAGAAVSGAEAGDDGKWSAPLYDLDSGTHHYTARAYDSAGNESPLSAEQAVIVTSDLPAPVITSPHAAFMNTSSITFAGIAPPSTQVRIGLQDGEPLVAPVDGDGHWSIELGPYDDGTYTFAARVENASDQSDPVTLTLTIDTQAPPAPQVADGSAAGSTVTLAGQAERGAVVTILEGSTAVAETTAGDDGAWRVTLTNVAPGNHQYTAVARDRAGNPSPPTNRDVLVASTQQATPTPTPTPTPTATPTPTPTPQVELPPPVTGKQVNAETKSGKVKVRLPGTKKFVVLGPGDQVPVGTTIDATRGRITLTTAVRGGKIQHADFYKGIFRVSQSKGKHPLTTLTLNGPKPTCTSAKQAKKAHASAKKKHKKKKRVKTRRLWGSGHGAFRTRGQFSSATVRGTTWLTQDSCAGTLIKVTRGAVTVRDFARHKKVVVRAGRHYLARAKKHQKKH